MAKSFKELQNENKAITKQLSKCAVNESIISKNYKELNTKYEKILEENKQIKNSEQFNKVLGIVPKIKSVLDSCKIVDKELQECKNDKYLHYSDSQINKNTTPIIPYGYGTWVYDKIYKDNVSPLPDGTLQIKPGNYVKPGLFKDAITAWNQKMYWHGDEYTPASPSDETMSYLDSAVTSATTHEEL